MRARPRITRLMTLFRWRSTVVFVACITGAACALVALAFGLIVYTANSLRPTDLLKYFTSISNLFSAFSAILLVPFVVEGHRMGYFTCPRWVALLCYSATICTTLTMIVAVCLISQVDPQAAFGGYYFFLHVLCPIVMLTAFLLAGSDVEYSVRDAVACTIPVYAYAICYYYMVVCVGADNGGWNDMYYVLDYMDPLVAVVAVAVIATGISLLIRHACRGIFIHRKREFHRVLEVDHSTPEEVFASALDMGRRVGLYVDESHLVTPVRLFSALSEYYDMDRRAITDRYTKGVLESLDEREERDA